MQAIVTKYMGPTNTRGGRIKATADAGSITIGYKSELNSEDNHRAAAVALCDKIDAEAVARRKGAEPGRRYWDPAELIGGGMPNDSGYCFVFAPGYAQMKGSLIDLVMLANKKRPDSVWDTARAAIKASNR
jgi:hypothetical protein